MIYEWLKPQLQDSVLAFWVILYDVQEQNYLLNPN